MSEKEIGTIAELDLQPGEWVECVSSEYGIWTGGKAYKMTPDGLICDRGVPLRSNVSTFRRIQAPTKGDTPHIIHHDGHAYDLTALETPFGLLPEPVQEALQAWPHGWEIFHWGWESAMDPAWFTSLAVRAKPAPEVKEWVLYWNAGRGASRIKFKEDTHRFIVTQTGDGPVTVDVEALADD